MAWSFSSSYNVEYAPIHSQLLMDDNNIDNNAIHTRV